MVVSLPSHIHLFVAGTMGYTLPIKNCRYVSCNNGILDLHLVQLYIEIQARDFLLNSHKHEICSGH